MDDTWEGIPERHNGTWLARIKTTGNPYGDPDEPQIGQRVHVKGNRKYGTGAEFIGKILAIRERDARSTLVLVEQAPWENETREAAKARKSVKAMENERAMQIREQLGLCVVCEEPKEDCACMRQARETLKAREREQERRRLLEEVEQHNRVVENNRKNVTKEEMAKAIEETNGDLREAAVKVGVAKRIGARGSWSSGRQIGDLEKNRKWIQQWLRRCAPELLERANELAERTTVE